LLYIPNPPRKASDEIPCKLREAWKELMDGLIDKESVMGISRPCFKRSVNKLYSSLEKL
jgi:hypothetical protein